MKLFSMKNNKFKIGKLYRFKEVRYYTTLDPKEAGVIAENKTLLCLCEHKEFDMFTPLAKFLLMEDGLVVWITVESRRFCSEIANNM